jgi:hypothetical protein
MLKLFRDKPSSLNQGRHQKILARVTAILVSASRLQLMETVKCEGVVSK